MNIKEFNKRKVPIVIIDNSLEKFITIPLFQDKVEKANEVLRKVGLPKQWTAKKKQHRSRGLPKLSNSPSQTPVS